MKPRSNTKAFIKSADKAHGSKYDYSKTAYSTSREKLIIICLIHGEFEQTANSHLNGSGCPSCGKVLRYSRGTKTKTTITTVTTSTTSELVDLAKERARKQSKLMPFKPQC